MSKNHRLVLRIQNPIRNTTVMSFEQGSYSVTGQNIGLESVDNVGSQAGDEQALRDFYTFADGPNWDWNGSAPQGWSSDGMDLDTTIDGVVTTQFNGETRVKELNLSGYPDGRLEDGSLEDTAPIGRNLSAEGDFPSTFPDLKRMTHLRLKGNNLYCNVEWLPDFAGSQLAWCSLSNASDTGGQGEIILDDLTNYNHPGKSRDSLNKFVGFIDSDLSGITNLDMLEIGSSVLIGSLPNKLPSGMRCLYLPLNNFSGDIGTTQYGNMVNMTHLYFNQRVSGERGEGVIGSVTDNGDGTYDIDFSSGSLDSQPSRSEVGDYWTNLTDSVAKVTAKNLPIWTINLLYGNAPVVDDEWRVADELDGRDGVTGMMPSDWDNMTKMAWFVIGGNRLEGQMPDFPSWTDLRQVNFDNFKSVSGGWPEWLTNDANNHTSLHTLVMSAWTAHGSGDGMTGELPQTVANPVGTAEFNLDNQSLTGAVPDWIPSGTKQLNLSNNGFTSLAGDFSAYSNLRFIYLYNNSIEGSLPAIDPSHHNFKEVRLENNKFSGTIPIHYGQFNSTGGDPFTLLRIDQNELEGPIPSEFFGATYSRNIANNFFVFADLVGNDLSNITYSPQKNFGSQNNYDSGTGIIDFSSVVSHADNVYEWQLDGSTVDGETSNTIDTGTHGAGTYQLIVTNTTLTDLTLNSVEITV